ncbi:MAG: hypothetical protein ABSA86_10555 [Oryzomonas sp.]|jgi:hypothetical protein
MNNRLLLIVALFITGCGNSGSTTTTATPATPVVAAVTGLAVANKVTTVNPTTTTSANKSIAQALRRALFTVPNFPATSDYNQDQTFTYVQDRSTDALTNVNQILCMISQTNYASMVNQGAYKALVDQNLCGGNNSSSGGAPNYLSWTVNVTRADNNSPEIVQAWVHQSSNGNNNGAALITAKMVVTAAASATNPIGLFTINYSQFPVTNGVPSTTASERGVLAAAPDASGNIVLSMISDGTQGGNGVTQIAFTKAADGSSGSGISTETPPSGSPLTLNFAYNSNYVEAAPQGATPICLDRTNYALTAWNYGLYDSNGTRVNLNGGFPISVMRNGAAEQGYIGYFGPWLPNGDTLLNGDVVTKLSQNGTAASGSYTALVAPGRLTKHTQKLLAMSDIQNIPLGYQVMSNSGPTSGPPTQYQVIWDGTNLTKNATWDNNSGSWTPMTPAPMDLSSLQSPSLNMNSDALGGQVYLNATCTQNSSSGNGPASYSCTVSASTPVIFYAQSTVFPGDTTVPTNLACVTGCPDPTGTPAYGNMADDETGFVNLSPAAALAGGKFTTYSFNPASYALNFGSATGPAVDGSKAQLYSNGVNSGPLFDPSVAANLTALQCNNNGSPNANQTCGWQAWAGIPEFYTWTSGAQSWQQLATLKDSNGNFVTFDQPLQLQYVHTGDSYAATYFLQYSGFGNLNGIPGVCVNMDTGAPADCSQQGNNSQINWVPEFSIAAGESVTGPKNTTYYIKPLQVEQRMLPAPSGSCQSLTMTNYTLPTISAWTDPALGTEPSVTAPPAVIGGVTQ